MDWKPNAHKCLDRVLNVGLNWCKVRKMILRTNLLPQYIRIKERSHIQLIVLKATVLKMRENRKS